MTKKETIKKNIGLTVDFVRQLIDEPKLIKNLPNKCEIDFIEGDFSSMTEKELASKKLVKVNHTFEIITKKKPTKAA